MIFEYIILRLPSCIQFFRFQALDCITVAGRRYVKVDTSLDCDSSESRFFRLLDGFFIAIYLGIPLLWLLLLCRRRAEMNPRTLDLRLKYYLRDRNVVLDPLRFLFDVYRPQFYFLDVVEMYVSIGIAQSLATQLICRASLFVLFVSGAAESCLLGFFRSSAEHRLAELLSVSHSRSSVYLRTESWSPFEFARTMR